MLKCLTIQQDIISILLRWKKYEIVFSADVEKMYRRIRVQNSDTEYQRIIWRANETEPIRDYKMTRVTFGTASALQKRKSLFWRLRINTSSGSFLLRRSGIHDRERKSR